MEILIIWNIIVFIIYGIDKMKAKRDKYRISEKILITITLLFGGLGAFFGMRIFRHKTKKPQFWLCALVGTLITVAVLYVGEWIFF
ncbi:MAG: DUF1294 domain-containing protein [Clostridia bacterium]|nr:DUF1294 domain-containing protein [Clostridia bacterium]